MSQKVRTAVTRWMILLICAPFIAIGGIYAGSVFGPYAYVGSAKTAVLAERDFQVGTAYRLGEREALLAACNKKFGKIDKKLSEGKCACWADKAEVIASSFDRVVITAMLDGSLDYMVGLGKGLVKSGFTQEEVNARTQNTAISFNHIASACLDN